MAAPAVGSQVAPADYQKAGLTQDFDVKSTTEKGKPTLQLIGPDKKPAKIDIVRHYGNLTADHTKAARALAQATAGERAATKAVSSAPAGSAKAVALATQTRARTLLSQATRLNETTQRRADAFLAVVADMKTGGTSFDRLATQYRFTTHEALSAGKIYHENPSVAGAGVARTGR